MVLRVSRGLLSPFCFSGFLRTFIYGVVYQTTLLFMTGQLKRNLNYK